MTRPATLGAAYGLRQSLDEAGPLLGPVLAVALMLLLAGDLRAAFWIACIPAAISLPIIAAGVREPAGPHRRPARPA